MPKLNWIVVAVVLSLTAGLLYMGHQAWHLRVIQNPLREKIGAIPGVLSLQLQPAQQKNVLVINLNQDAEFPRVASQVKNIVGQEPYEIVWGDNPNTHLLEVRKGLDLALQEARWRHQFLLLQERMEEFTRAHAVEYQLGVDEEYIYVALLDGTHILREAIPLIQVGGGAN